MIRQRLMGERPIPRSNLILALRSPWCWPREPELAALAARQAAPPSLVPGRAIGVTVGSSEALWELGHEVGNAPLVGEASAARWRAPRLAVAAAPVVARRDGLRAAPHAEAVLLVANGPVPGVIEGGSFGLALVLLHVSWLLHEPVPADLWAAAATRSDGRCAPVDGLDRKLGFARDAAPGVARVVVFDEQAKAVKDPHGFELVPVGSVEEAVRVAFPDIEDRIGARWQAEPEVAAEVARELRRVSVFGAPLTSWRSVHRTAERLMGALPAEHPARADAELAWSIAGRHEGGVPPIPVPTDAELQSVPRPRRLRWAAHIVQSWADAGDDPSMVKVAEWAKGLLAPPSESTEHDVVLLGAIGRALASAGEDREAARVLTRAVASWMELEAEASASYALSELARVAGVLGDRALLERCEGWVEACGSRVEAEPTGEAFVRLALARGWALVGEHERAAAHLASVARVDELLLPAHLRGARDRWRARVLDGLGRTDAADALRSSLQGEIALLARLDQALDRGLPTEEPLGAVAGAPGLRADVERLIARCPPSADPARFVADHFRY